MSFPSLATAFTPHNKPELVYNPSRRLEDEEVGWLRSHEQTLAGISQYQFDKRTLYGNSKPMQYMLNSEGSIDAGRFNPKNPFHKDAVAKAVH